MPRRLLTVLALSVLGLSAGACQGTHQPGTTGPGGNPFRTSAGPSSGTGGTGRPSGTATRSPTPGRTTAPGFIPTSARPSGTGHPTTSAPPSPVQPGLPAGLKGRDFEVIPTKSPVVALTFDGGANADGLASVLATLSAQHVLATFFLTGDFARAYPAQVRAIVAAGHRLGNHSVDHPYFTGLTDAQIRAQLADAEAMIRAAGGTSSRPLFRFPYGDRNARTIAAVNSAGYVPVRWTVDTLGWKGTGSGVTAATVVGRIVAAATLGEIVLMHVGSNPDDHSTVDADALPTVIARLRSLGYSFVTLDALVG